MEAKQTYKRVSEVGSGIHLLVIKSVRLYKDASNTPILMDNKYNGLVILLGNKEGAIHEQIFWLGSELQHYFDNLMACIGIDTSGEQVPVKTAIGKHVWTAIKEIHWVKNGELYIDPLTNNEKVEFQAFKYFPVFYVNKKPTYEGNPQDNGGEASGAFYDYYVMPEEVKAEPQVFIAASTHSYKPIPPAPIAPLPTSPAPVFNPTDAEDDDGPAIAPSMHSFESEKRTVPPPPPIPGN